MSRITVVDESKIKITVSAGVALFGELSGKLEINLENVADLTNAQQAAFRLAIFAATKGDLPDTGEITGDHIAQHTITIDNLDDDVLIGKLDTDLGNALPGAWATQKTVILRELTIYDISQVDGLLEEKLDVNLGNPDATAEEIIEFRNYLEAASVDDITGINTTITALALTVHNTETGIRALITFETGDRQTADTALDNKITVEVADRIAGDDALGRRIDNIDTGLSGNDEARIQKNTDDIASSKVRLNQNTGMIRANSDKIEAAQIKYRVVVDRDPLLLADELQHPHYSNSQVIEFTAPTTAKAGFYADTFNNDGAIVTAGGGIDRAGIILRAVQVDRKITVHLDRPIDLGDEAFYYNETENKQVLGGRGGAITDEGVWVVAGRGDVSDLKDELDITLEAVVALANSHVILHDVVIGESILLGRAWTHPATDNNVITFTFDSPDSALAVAGILRGGAIGPVAGDENDARIVVSVVNTDDIHIIKVFLDGPLVVAASTSESSLIKFWRATSSGPVTRLIGLDYDADTRAAIGVGPSRLDEAIAGVMTDTNTLLETFRNITIETNKVVSGNIIAIQGKLGSDLSNYTGTRADGEAFLNDELFGMTTEQVATAISLAVFDDTRIKADIEEAKVFYTPPDSIVQVDPNSFTIAFTNNDQRIIFIAVAPLTSALLQIDVEDGFITSNGGSRLRPTRADINNRGVVGEYNHIGGFQSGDDIKLFAPSKIQDDVPVKYITGGRFEADIGRVILPTVMTYNNEIFNEVQGTASARFEVAVNTVYLYSNDIYRIGTSDIVRDVIEHITLPPDPNINDLIEFYTTQNTRGSKDISLDAIAPPGVKINGVAAAVIRTPSAGGGYRVIWTGQSNIGWALLLTTGRI